MFLGVVVALPVPALLNALERLPAPLWHWRLLGVALLGVGLLLFHFSRKRFRVQDGKLTVQDGLLSAPVHYLWEGQADIHLSSYETNQGESWAVDLVCGKIYYRIHHGLDHLCENLSLAVALARATGGSLVETSDAQPVVIAPEELGMPYRERVQRHPQLLPPEVAKPKLCTVVLIEENGQQRFRWQLSWPHIGPYLMMLTFVMAVLAGVPPLSSGDATQSAFNLAQAGRSYTYFILCGAVLSGLLLVASGFRKELLVGPESLCSTSSLWGIPLGSACVPVGEVQDIWVRELRSGAQLQFVSEGRCLGGHVSDLPVARWVAAQVARSLAFH